MEAANPFAKEVAMIEWRKAVCSAALTLSCFTPALAQDVGHQVERTGKIAENYYAAGGTVRARQVQVTGDLVSAGGVVEVDGDVSGNTVVAGGEVRLQQRAKGDLFAAGGNVEVRGEYADDVRVAGGEVTVYAHVTGDLIAAGGRVHVAPGSRIGGRTALAGGKVVVSGIVDKRLHAAGSTVTINGVVNGDADIEARHVILGPTARITGDLSYRSPEPAQIDPAAKVTGKVEHLVSPLEKRAARAKWWFALVTALTLAFSVWAIGAAWYGAFPNFSRAAPGTLATAPLWSLIAGLIVVFATPPAAIGLAAVVIGLPIAGLLFVLYPAALLLGLVTSALWVSVLALRRTAGGITTARRVTALLAVAAVLGIVSLIPILGWLVVFAAVVMGTGALWLRLLRADAAT
ncbi:MAG TPA: hypothetical protein VF678_04015 [bacterium]